MYDIEKVKDRLIAKMLSEDIGSISLLQGVKSYKVEILSQEWSKLKRRGLKKGSLYIPIKYREKEVEIERKRVEEKA